MSHSHGPFVPVADKAEAMKMMGGGGGGGMPGECLTIEERWSGADDRHESIDEDDGTRIRGFGGVRSRGKSKGQDV